MKRLSVVTLLQTALAALLLLGTAWLLWPWPDRQVPAASFWPTLTATMTRVLVRSPTRVPTATPFVPTATPKPVIHIVQPKEVLGVIAKEYGVTLEALMAANDIKDANLVRMGQKLIIPNPQRTPVFTPTRTVPVTPTPPTPTSTPTSAWRYDAPLLLAPSNGEAFAGPDAVIALRWACTAPLQESEYYEVKLWSAGQDKGDVLRFYTQTSSWTVPASLYAADKIGVWYWTVSVVYRARRNIVLSPEPSPWQFHWK